MKGERIEERGEGKKEYEPHKTFPYAFEGSFHSIFLRSFEWLRLNGVRRVGREIEDEGRGGGKEGEGGDKEEGVTRVGKRRGRRRGEEEGRKG